MEDLGLEMEFLQANLNAVEMRLKAPLDEPMCLRCLTSFNQLVKQGVRHFFLDLSGAKAISMSGLGMLNHLQQEVEVLGGRLVLFAAEAGQLKLLRLSGLTQRIVLETSREEARKNLSQGGR